MASNPDRESPSAPRGRPRSWPETWARALLEIASVSPQRRAVVLDDIVEGSKPTTVYYVLLGLSELIAGFALIIDSDATLIGANVVAPLMTPIFGISLGLMRGDLRLLRVALIAELGGAAFGALLCFLIGLLPFMLEPTPALLAQTRPTLIDLFVAALAGFAGGLAMIDERISPALPGVAIATALNPPIAAVGLCLAVGAYEGAWGAFLLFFANVLAILGVAAVLFIIAGFVTREEVGSLRSLWRRFAPAAIGFVLVTGLLTQYLIEMVTNLQTNRAIATVLDAELSHEPNTTLAKVEFSRRKDGVEVLSSVDAPRILSPSRVKTIQDALAAKLGEPVRLFMRCNLTKDVTATGSTNIRPYLGLNGSVSEQTMSAGMQLVQQAEQVAREVVATRPDIVLKDIELVDYPTGPVLLVSIESPRLPRPEQIEKFETVLRERLHTDIGRVVVRVANSVDVTSKGRILFGEAHFTSLTDEQKKQRDAVERAITGRLERLPNVFVNAIDAVRRGDGWAVRAELTGARVPEPSEIRDAEKSAAQAVGTSVALVVRASPEVLVDRRGYQMLGQGVSSDDDEDAGRDVVQPSPAPTARFDSVPGDTGDSVSTEPPALK